MSVNPTLKHNKIQNDVSTFVSIPDTNSILSDDQSLYVLFNPINEESDILSFTNTAQSSDNNGANICDGSVEEWEAPEGFYDTEHNSYDSLTIKIHKWNMGAGINDLVDDNTASWDLDEKLSADTLLHKEFYGDELFKDFTKDEFKKFKRFHFKDIITAKNRDLANHMLIKLLIDNRELQKNKLVGCYEMSSHIRDYISNLNNNVEVSDTNSSLILC